MAMKKSSSSKKSTGVKKAQVGQFIKKICRPGDTSPGCAGTRGMSGYGGGGRGSRSSGMGRRGMRSPR